jgi:hypothetical protein
MIPSALFFLSISGAKTLVCHHNVTFALFFAIVVDIFSLHNKKYCFCFSKIPPQNTQGEELNFIKKCLTGLGM